MPKPMVLVTIYPDGWVETRSTDDVAVRIHTVPAMGWDVNGTSAASLRQAFSELPWKWQQLVGETDARGVETGLPNACPEDERSEMAAKWVACDTFAAAVEADDELRLDLVQVTIPEWMQDHAEKVRLAKVGRRWREMYQDQRQGV